MLSQFSREGDKQTLADLSYPFEKDVYPVGRLDYNSEGLLLLSNDKRLNQQILLPGAKIQKTYWVQVEGLPSNEQIKQLQQGVQINIKGKKHQTSPATVHLIAQPKVPERHPPIRFRANIPTQWLSISITEGKNRQIRRMTAAVGLPTLRLIRFSIGKLNISQLAPGDVQAIHVKELKNQLFHF